jgi:hypothetical protein
MNSKKHVSRRVNEGAYQIEWASVNGPILNKGP